MCNLTEDCTLWRVPCVTLPQPDVATFPQALIWLPCGTVLTGGMHDDFNPNPAFMKCNLPQLTAADVSDK